MRVRRPTKPPTARAEVRRLPRLVVVPRSFRNRARIPGIRIVAQGEPFESRRGTARGDRTDHRARGPLGGRLRRRPLRRRHRVAELRVDALHRHANDPSTRRSDPIGTRALGILGTPVLLGTLGTLDRFADDHREDVPGGDEPRRLESTRHGVLDGAASRPRVGGGRRGRDERRGDARGGDDDGARARCGFDDARHCDRDRRRRDRGRPPGPLPEAMASAAATASWMWRSSARRAPGGTYSAPGTTRQDGFSECSSV